MSPRLRRLLTVLSCLNVFMLPAAAQSIGTVVASGPEIGNTLEDRVEISWSIATPVPSTSSFVIRRDGDLIGLVASTVTLYEDLTAIPGTTYDYCVHIRAAGGAESPTGVCDEGARVINRPTGFTASDGMYEDRVLLSWSDRSEIETGFNLYRDAGYALDFDGVDDYVAVPGNTVLSASFTVEFWASRRSINARHYVINLESTSVGDPTTVDLEIGFNSLNQFVVGFGANVLASTTTYTDQNWRHFAVTYDAASRRRTLYVDGEPVGTNIYASSYRPTGALEFGRQTGNGNRNQRGHFNGRVDELRLWNVALTRSEVQSQITRLLPGAQPALVAHWPMDVMTGLAVPDIAGTLSGVIQNPNLSVVWSLSEVPDYRTDIAANLTSYSDRATVPGYDSYTYSLLAYEDVNGDGSYTPDVDYTSEERTDMGWRARLAPPGNVSATDGQFTDRVRITWVDRSDSENGYSIYRNDVQIGSVPADGTLYDDFAATGTHTYCVAASNGVESMRVCDEGTRGGLPAPTTVAATNGTFDDRVLVTWADISDTESGFEVFRTPDGGVETLVGTTSANAQEFADLTALQEVLYTYSVRAFSLADPENPSYSAKVLAPEKGKREAVLRPENVTATDAEFEDRVEVAWTNPSKTVMLFKVYRSGTLIDVLDFRVTSATDTGILSGTDYNYCVSAETVVATSSDPLAMQGQIAQTLESIRLADAVLLETGGEATSPEVKLSEIYRSVGLDAAGKTGAEAAGGVFESALVCDPGSRLLAAPTAANATDDEFETHVQLTWEDNSQIETGYKVYRAPSGGAQALIATLSPNRTTYGDYTGASGVQYTYFVEAFDAFDKSVADDDPGKRTLNPPTALVASDGTSETVVELDWKDNSDAELGYRIYRRVVGGDPNWTVIGTTGTNEPAFTNVLAEADLGVEFEYSVVAFDGHGESLPASDIGKSKIEAPTNVYASEGYENTTIVVWIDRSNVESGYRVTRRVFGSGAGTATPIAIEEAGVTKYEDTSGTLGIPYEYCVQALFGTGNASEAVCDVGTRGSLAGGGGGGGGTPGLEPVRIIGPTVGAQFGWSVEWNSGQTLVGAPGATPQGKAYRYSVDTPTNMWTQQEAWAPATNGQRFGHAVDIDGNRAIVGDPFALNDNKGGFSIWNQTGGSPWSEQLGLYPPDAGAVDNTGFSVAVAGDWTVIGNNQYAATGNANLTLPALHGGAIVCNPSFTPTTTDNNVTTDWPRCEDSDGYKVPRLEAILANNKRVKDAAFGYAVEMVQADGILFAFVGAPGDDKAYVFSCSLANPLDCTSPNKWALVQEIDTPFRPRGNRFGAAIAADDTFAAIGAPGAAAVLWLKRNTEGKWDEVSTLTCSKIKGCDAASSPEFGAALTVHNAKILIGAPGEKVANVNAAGAAYLLSLSPSGELLGDPIRYDARAVKGWNPIPGARFGAAVSASPDFYLVGAPMDVGDVGQQPAGALYSIPVGTPATKEPPTPVDVTLVAPTNVRASDGTAPDRIQIRWKDESDSEDGHMIFRSREGGAMEELAQVAANIQFYDDFEAAPGEAYTYCVAAFFSNTGQSAAVCDIGWRPANGTIAGRLAAREGGGTDGAQVCLLPSPNKSLVFDGYAGYVETAVGEALDLEKNFTVEAWIRPNAVDNLGYVVFKDSAYALAVENGKLRYDRFGDNDTWETKVLVDGTAQMTLGQWVHVALTHAEGNDIRLFRNGTQVALLPSTKLASTVGDTLTIGASIEIVDRTRKNFFRGEMDEVRIWSIAKSASEIAEARFDVLRGDEENLVAYWPLDDGRRRIVPDLTEGAGHGRLIDGVYLADEGAPLEICAPTASDGNYSISRIRYGQSAEFNVIPTRSGRAFTPSFKKITLTTESPVQNEVAFTDVTAYPIAGFVQYEDVFNGETFTCPVPNVKIHVDKHNVATDGNLKTTTGADGSYTVAVDPSKDARDAWYVIPQFTSLSDAEQVHTFSPSRSEQVVTGPVKGLNFKDLRRHTLSGNFSGGDPEFCSQNIGAAKIRIYTQDGCYDRTIDVNSSVAKGAFSVPLPPLKYLVEIVKITDAPDEREDEIKEFFKKLGTLEVDLTGGNVERNLIYRAPLVLAIEGLDAPTACSLTGIVQKDEEGTILRTLPNVPTIGEYGFRQLTIRVREDYGSGQFCNVDEGTVTIFDGIADRADSDSTMALQAGKVEYATFGASANIFSGARIQGIDRSFQKPITVVAQVEGVKPLVETRWALVEGARARSATFVSATTEEFPLMILHDPPGSNSNAFLEKGSTYCSRISKTKLVGGGAGLDLDVKLGVVFETGFSFGAHWATVLGVAFNLRNRTIIGRENGSLDGDNIEICLQTTEQFSTSSDPGGVGEDIHIGVALNLIFAIADVLKAPVGTCAVTLSETLAADLNQTRPFETNYVYSKTHIAASLIPELENLIKIAGGDASLTGPIAGTSTTIRLKESLDNWKKQLKNSQKLKAQALASPLINRSFSGNTSFSYAEAVDTTRVTSYEYTRIYVNSAGDAGLWLNFGAEQRISIAFEVKSEWVTEKEETQSTSKAIGYTLNDEDTGDYFSVDVAKDPRYGTFVFGTKSGRSSNPWEANTQKRDNPIILVDPPVRYNVDPSSAGSFELTLINGSESNERRLYALTAPAQTNRNNLTLMAGGGYLDGEPYLLDPGKAITVKLDAYASPSAFSYKRVGVVLYPETERTLWTGDVRNPFALADTAFFSVYFDSTGGKVMASVMSEGWTWFSLNREGGDVNRVLRDIPSRHGDVLRSQTAESRYDSTAGWTGSLTRLNPGEGYRIRLQEPSVLRIVGDPVEAFDPIKLKPGWSWIGFLPAKGQRLDDALASLENKVQDGDMVLGQRAFAQYVKGKGWIGTLQEMLPGEGYAIQLALGGELRYPKSVENPRRPSVSVRERTVRGPAWEIAPERFDGSMTMVAEVRLSDVPLEQTTARVAVFAGDSLRGVGDLHYVESQDRYLAFLVIYGGQAGDEEPFRVHVFDGEKDKLYEDVGSFRYAAQSMLGNPVDPMVLELTAAGQAPELSQVPKTFALHQNYPNPFNPATTIAYDLPEAAHVQIMVYDVLGRHVSTLVDGDLTAGHHKAVFDAKDLASGFYLYKLKAGDFTQVHKMILVK